jgi:plastocyanin
MTDTSQIKNLILTNTDLPAPTRIQPVVAPPAFKPVTGTIQTGAKIEAGGFAVSAAGGEVNLQGSGTALDGFKLEVPPNAYKQNVNFKLSFAPITSHTFGSKFKTVSPLFSLSNGEVLSDQALKVKLPAAIPPDHFAMAFYYDSARQRLEGLPLLARDAGSVTAATRHFSNLVVGAIPEEELPKEVDSGFRPGFDDWQFTNYGSAIAMGGHCAGQTLTALWYFTEKPDGTSTRLWGKYDNFGSQPTTPQYWQDDNQAYRLASMAQNSIDWDGMMFNFFLSVPEKTSDLTTMMSFILAMAFTGEPQFVGIFSTAKGGGHALIVYRVTAEGLWVADPNYPSNSTRLIRWNGASFDPYESGANAEEIRKGNSKRYDKIVYIAKSAMIGWPQLADMWQQMKNGTAGNGMFPKWKLSYYDDLGVAHEAQRDANIITGRNALPVDWNWDWANKMGSVIMASVNGQVLKSSEDYTMLDGHVAIPLNAGLNKVGITLFGITSGADGIKSYHYVDHLYLNVTSGGTKIEPASLDGTVGTSYAFTAAAAPGVAVAEYAWDFGDNSTLRSPSNRVNHTFTRAGSYSVYVALYDKAGKIISEARAPARISDKAAPTTSSITLTSLLQSMKTLQVKLEYSATVQYTVSGQAPTSAKRAFVLNFPVTSADSQLFLIGTPDAAQAITWSGNAFSGNQGDPATAKGVSRLSGNFPYLDTLNMKAEFTRNKLPVSVNSYANTSSLLEVANLRIQGANLKTAPITADQKEVRFEFTGSQVKPYLRNMGNDSETLQLNPNRNQYELASAAVQNEVDWNTLKLTLVFKK